MTLSTMHRTPLNNRETVNRRDDKTLMPKQFNNNDSIVYNNQNSFFHEQVHENNTIFQIHEKNTIFQNFFLDDNSRIDQTKKRFRITKQFRNEFQVIEIEFQIIEIDYSIFFQKRREFFNIKNKELETFIDLSQKQNIVFIDDHFYSIRKKNVNRTIYNKTVYNQNVMIILLINNNVFEMNIFQKIESENVAATKILYQMLSNAKKKRSLKSFINYWIIKILIS